MFFQFLVAVIMCLLVDLYDLLNQMMSLILLFDFVTTVGIIQMRFQKPDIERPIKVGMKLTVLPV